MHDRTFDDLLRKLSQSRRSAIAILIAAAGSVTGLAGTDSKKRKRKHKKKNRGGTGTTTAPATTAAPSLIRCEEDEECPVGLNCDSRGLCTCVPTLRCTGCCLSESQCLMLEDTLDNACGIDGFECRACAAETRCTQSNRLCRCDEHSTQGCCNIDGLFGYPGTADENCGQHGEVCVDCKARGEVCVNHACQPKDCTRDCDESGRCVEKHCFGQRLCCQPSDIAVCNVPDLVCNCLVEGGHCASYDM